MSNEEDMYRPLTFIDELKLLTGVDGTLTPALLGKLLPIPSPLNRDKEWNVDAEYKVGDIVAKAEDE